MNEHILMAVKTLTAVAAPGKLVVGDYGNGYAAGYTAASDDDFAGTMVKADYGEGYGDGYAAGYAAAGGDAVAYAAGYAVGYAAGNSAGYTEAVFEYEIGDYDDEEDEDDEDEEDEEEDDFVG